MKKALLIQILILFIFGFSLSSCSSSARVSEIVETEMPNVENTRQEAKPTESPTPIPCTIAFESNRDGKNRDIFIMEPDGSNPANLTKHKSDDWAPAWSPDGRQIAFVSNRGNGDSMGMFIFVMNADGSGLQRLTNESDSNNPDWSNDGKMIVYESSNDIFITQVDGSNGSKNLTNSKAKDRMPSFSPDSQHIAWLSDGNIFTMDVDGNHVKQITNEGNLDNVKWTQDGLLYTAPWNSTRYGNGKFVMNADGTNVTPAGGKGELYKYFPFWTKDGQVVECVDIKLDGKQSEIFLISEIYPDIFFNLSNNPAEDTRPDWPANCYKGREITTPKIAPTQTTIPTQTATPEPKEIVLGYAEQEGQPPYRRDNFTKACVELGIRCEYGGLTTLVEKGVNAVIQNTGGMDINSLEGSVLKAKEKGITVFLLDSEVEMDGAYNITIHQEDRVRIPLEWMFNNMGGKGEFSFFVPQTDSTTVEIINKLLAENPGIQPVNFEMGNHAEINDIKQAVYDFLKMHPGLKGLWTEKWITEFIFGVADNISPKDDWPLLNCEATKAGLNIWKDRLKDFPKMKCIAVSNPPGIAYDAAYAAYYLAKGEKLDAAVLSGATKRTLFVEMITVTNANLNQWMGKIKYDDDQPPLNEWMKPEQIMEKWFLEK